MNTFASIKQTLLTQWTLIRWLRLIAGVFFMAQAIQMHDSITGFISSLLLFQALTNTGCCGVGGCAVPTQEPAKNDAVQEVEYEEITGK